MYYDLFPFSLILLCLGTNYRVSFPNVGYATVLGTIFLIVFPIKCSGAVWGTESYILFPLAEEFVDDFENGKGGFQRVAL